MSEPQTNRERVKSLMQLVDEQLQTWRKWFPDEESEVKVARADLLALIEFAKVGLEVIGNGQANSEGNG